MEQTVAVDHVRKVYGSGLEAIREVSFGVGPGEVRVDGRAVRGPRREIGVVFQAPVLLPWRTVLDNVLLPIEMLRLPRARYVERARELLATVKIGDFAGRLPRELSGGMRQRVSICRALIHDPEILLMDEPFSALDAITRDQMGQELLRIWEHHRKTVVFVTHSIREAVFLSDRVVVMAQRPATITLEVEVK